MALNSTQTQSLKSLTLNDLILSKSALENIVENNELKEILSGYVPLSSYNTLLQRVEAIELAGVNSYAEDKDTLCAACQQLCMKVSTLTGEISELNRTVQDLCALVQTNSQHNSAQFSNVNAAVAPVIEELPNTSIQMMAAMPERNNFAIAEDQLPAEVPVESKIEKHVENSITITTSKSRKKKNR